MMTQSDYQMIKEAAFIDELEKIAGLGSVASSLARKFMSSAKKAKAPVASAASQAPSAPARKLLEHQTPEYARRVRMESIAQRMGSPLFA